MDKNTKKKIEEFIYTMDTTPTLAQKYIAYLREKLDEKDKEILELKEKIQTNEL